MSLAGYGVSLPAPTVDRAWTYAPPAWAAAITDGGTGGTVIKVTNTNADGAGSLKAAIETAGARIIVFEVGGVIDLDGATLTVADDDCTIAGQTAPAPGIGIIKGRLVITADDVIVTHLAVRPGDRGLANGSGWEADCISTVGASRVVIDHCSATWGTDECLSASASGRHVGEDAEEWRANSSNNIAITNCLIAEGLNNSTHSGGPHSKGSTIIDNGNDIWFWGNLYASNAQRNPELKGGCWAAFVNNYVVNHKEQAMAVSMTASEWSGKAYEDILFDSIGNVIVPGLDEEMPAALRITGTGDTLLYSYDNYVSHMAPLFVSLDGNGSVTAQETPSVWDTEWDTLEATVVMTYVSTQAGSRPWDRDPIDARIVAQALARTTRIIDSQDEVEGYPTAGTVSTRAFDEDEWDMDTMAPVGGVVPE